MKANPSPAPKRSRCVKVLLWLGGALAVYAILGFFVAPAVVKAQMLKRLPPLLKRPVAVAEVRCNPFAFSATFRGFAVNENNGARFAGWDELYARLAFSSFFHRGWTVREISLTHPFAQISRAKDGKLNFDDILAALAAPSTAPAAPAPKPGKTALPLVVIDLLHIEGADVSVEDFAPPKPVRAKLLPVHLTLENLSTAPGARNPYIFSAASDTGESFQWSGAFSLDPVQVSGSFAVKQLDLKKYSPYLAPFVLADVVDGRLDVLGNYTAALASNGPDLSLSKMEVLLQKFAVKSTATGETVVSVPLLSVSLAEADLGKRLVHITSFATADGSLLVRQEKDGKINLLSMLVASPASPAPTSAPAASQTPWTATVDDIAVERYALQLEDNKPDKPAKFSVKDIVFKAKGFSTAGSAPITNSIGMTLGESGRFTASGSVRLQPPSANLALQLVGLDLRPFQPYVEQQAKLAVTSGLLSFQGRAGYNTGNGAPLATFDGDVGLTNFVTADLLHYKDFVKFNALAVSGIKFAFQPNRVEVGEIKLDGLSASAMIDSNKQINLLTVLPKTAPAATSAPPPAAPAGPGFPAALGSFVFDNASFHFTDQSVEPNCLFDFQRLDGSVKGLSSQPDSRAAVDLHGKVDEVSSFAVTGGVNVLSTDLVVQLAVDCKNMDLTPFTPYMEKFGGYPLNRGKLVLDLRYDIAHRKLDASNNVTVAGMTLGARNASTNATHLPVKLAIALLKDRKGNIDLDVPLHGSLDDPTFRIWPIVWQVVGNLLEKAATAPFTLLGKLFGGGEEMSFVDFQPGLSDISPPEQEKIVKLANSLYERPELSLEITATSDPPADSPALARLKLEDQIRSLRAKELIAAGTPAETVQSVKVEPADYSRLIKDLYLQTFGTNATDTNASAASTTETNVAAAPPSAPPAAPAVSTNIQSSPPPSAPVPTKPQPIRVFSSSFVKGGELMMQRTQPGRPVSNPAPAVASTPPPASTGGGAAQTSAVTTNAAPANTSEAAANTNAAPAVELTQEQMEAALLAGIQITPDDLRALMVARAHSVQTALANTVKVEGGRMTILSPRPVNSAAKGQARVNLALD